jgi:hypothetical protein
MFSKSFQGEIILSLKVIQALRMPGATLSSDDLRYRESDRLSSLPRKTTGTILFVVALQYRDRNIFGNGLDKAQKCFCHLATPRRGWIHQDTGRAGTLVDDSHISQRVLEFDLMSPTRGNVANEVFQRERLAISVIVINANLEINDSVFECSDFRTCPSTATTPEPSSSCGCSAPALWPCLRSQPRYKLCSVFRGRLRVWT